MSLEKQGQEELPVPSRRSGRPSIPVVLGLVILGAALLAGAYLLSRQNYLLFHSSVEMLGVVVCFTIFSIGWNARHFTRNNTLIFLAIAYLLVAFLDFLHLLAYKGMGVFPGRGSDLATQLWIAARYAESLSLLGGALLLTRERPLHPGRWFGLYLLAAVTLYLLLVTWSCFPSCYIEGEGLTPFKVTSEYIVSGLLLVAGLLFFRHRDRLDRHVLRLLLASIAVTILSEMSFTLYTDIYGFFNFLGHALKLLSLLFLYLALIQGSLRTPYAMLFHRLATELEERKRYQQRLEAANRELDAFVYTVAHDLRSPLTPIIGFAEVLHEQCRDKLDAQEQTLLQTVQEQARGLLSLLEDLLILSKVGHLERPAAPIEAREVVDEVLAHHRSQKIDINCTVRIGDLPSLRVPKTLVSQVFGNLLGNALRYACVDQAPLEISGHRQGDVVQFMVRDHGPGIPPEERERIFEVFFRGSGGKSRPGTGIGLATVSKIARLYDGRAWVEETPGGGATFRVEMTKV